MRVRLGALRSGLHLPVVVPAGLLVLLGLVVLSGLEVRVGSAWIDDWHVRQLVGVLLGLAASAVLLLVPYKAIVGRAYLLYAANLLLLVAALGVGAGRNETRRWIPVFGFDLQPSELMKLTLVVTLARFIRFRSSHKTFRGLGAPFVLTLLPMGLILLQPDLGTALLFVPILFAMLFVAGARPRHLLAVVALGALAVYPMYRWGLHDYQRQRIDGFLVQLDLRRPSGGDGEAMRRRELYQVDKARVAVGVGGLAGADADSAGAAALRRVPERHNDFVFAAVANRLGWLGCATVLGLLAWLLRSVLAVALRQRDPAGRLICAGVFASLGFQALVNVAMTVGLVPVTGLTLPFLSYGRSSIVSCLLAVALVGNVAARPSYEFGRGDL